MSQIDTVRQLVLDKSAADMSGAANYAAAIADTAAQCTRLDCEVAEQVDVTVKITNLGSGPATKILVVGRCSSAADPDAKHLRRPRFGGAAAAAYTASALSLGGGQVRTRES